MLPEKALLLHFRVKPQCKTQQQMNLSRRLQNELDFQSRRLQNELDFQVENLSRAAYISRKALVLICQGPSQQMSQLKIFYMGGNSDNLFNLDMVVQVVQVKS